MSVGVHNGALAAQLHDLADNEDVAVDVVIEVRAGDARGFHGGHGGQRWDMVKKDNARSKKKVDIQCRGLVSNCDTSLRGVCTSFCECVCMEGQTRSTRYWGMHAFSIKTT